MQSLILHPHVFLKDGSEQCLFLNWETFLFLSISWAHKPGINILMQVQEEKKAGRREGGGRGGSLLKQQANTWACVPVISKGELVALVLCEVIVFQGIPVGGLLCREGNSPMPRSEAQLWSDASRLGGATMGLSPSKGPRIRARVPPHQTHLPKQLQGCSFKSYTGKFSHCSVNYSSKLNKCAHSSAAVTTPALG